jgi:BlaI family transcriptional regulator, penicillinase repressor
MARTPQDITEAEMAVLQVLWDRGPVTRRQITDVLYPGGGPAHFTTVQKLLERLEVKGCVSKHKADAGQTFTAVIDRDELIGRRLRHMAEQLCGGSLTPLMMNLVKSQPLSTREVAELRALLEQHMRRPGKR